MSVQPEGTGGEPLRLRVAVFGSDGSPIPNRTVMLTVDGIERTGGHQHDGTMPNGVLSQTQVNTGPSGIAEVEYTPGVFSGKVFIRGTSGSATPAEDTITVEVSGLNELQESATVRLIGMTTAHPSSHWERLGGSVHDETRTAQPHYHLRF